MNDLIWEPESMATNNNRDNVLTSVILSFLVHLNDLGSQLHVTGFVSEWNQLKTFLSLLLELSYLPFLLNSAVLSKF